MVAIPCAVGYSYLSSRVNALMHDMERAGIEIVNLISESREAAAAPEIIEFGPQPSQEFIGVGSCECSILIQNERAAS